MSMKALGKASKGTFLRDKYIYIYYFFIFQEKENHQIFYFKRKTNTMTVRSVDDDPLFQNHNKKFMN